MKRLDFPPNMRSKQLAGGRIGYYWQLQKLYRDQNCPLASRALDVDLAKAITEAKRYNRQLRKWIANKEDEFIPFQDWGSINWLIESYQNSDSFRLGVSERAKPDYKKILSRLSNYTTKSGDKLGSRPVSDLNAKAARRIYYRIIGYNPDTLEPETEDPLYRSGEILIDVAKTAWKTVHFEEPRAFDASNPNPWSGVKKIRRKKAVKKHVTREQVYNFAYGALDLKAYDACAAVLICYEWVIRPETVISGSLTWSDFRSKEKPHHVRIFHVKTKVEVMQALDDLDEEGNAIRAFFPEMEKLLRAMPDAHPTRAIVCRQNGSLHDKYSLGKRIRELRSQISGVPEHFTLDACRHGGMTEFEERGLTAGQGRSISGHKTDAAYRGYAKLTETRNLEATRLRFPGAD